MYIYIYVYIYMYLCIYIYIYIYIYIIYKIASTEITNTEIFAFTPVQVTES